MEEQLRKFQLEMSETQERSRAQEERLHNMYEFTK